MRVIKFLCVTLILTFITSAFNVCASYYHVDTLLNKIVPGFNQSWNSEDKFIDTVEMGRHHLLSHVNVTRELDVKLRKYDSTNKKYLDAGWKILKTGSTSQLTNSSSPVNFFMQGGTFDLYFDSRWHYTSDTTIQSLIWRLHDGLT